MTDELTPVSILRGMVDIASPTGQEAELAEYVVNRMHALGFRTHIDTAGNAIGEIGGSNGPEIMLLGHLDTAPGHLPVHERNGVLHGRGTVDAKGPLAAMICAAARSDARVTVVGAVGEEGTSPGAWHLLSGAHPDAVIIGEPSGVRNVVVGYKGITRFGLHVTRPPAHTSTPEPKAVEVAVDFWRDVRAHLADLYPDGRPFDRAIPALVRLCGDPCRAEADIYCRTPLGFDAAAFRAWLCERAGDDVLTFVEELPAVRSSRADPVARALAGAVRAHVGPPVAKVKLGTSDMNIVGPAWSVPMATYGPGDARLDHSDEERIDLGEYVTAISVLRTAISRIAGIVPASASHQPASVERR